MSELSRRSYLDVYVDLAVELRGQMHDAQIAWVDTPRWRPLRRRRARRRIDTVKFQLHAAEGAAVTEIRKRRGDDRDA